MDAKELERQQELAEAFSSRVDRIALVLMLGVIVYWPVVFKFGAIDEYGRMSAGYLVGFLVLVAVTVVAFVAAQAVARSNARKKAQIAQYHERIR